MTDFIKRLDWDDLWIAFFMLLVIVVLSVGAFALTREHQVRRYYIGMSEASTGIVSCVFADNPWERDDQVFCAVDPAKTLDFMKQANDALVKAPR